MCLLRCSFVLLRLISWFIFPLESEGAFYSGVELCAGLGEIVGPRLRDLASAARGSQKAGFAQPRAHAFAQPCIRPQTSFPPPTL